MYENDVTKRARKLDTDRLFSKGRICSGVAILAFTVVAGTALGEYGAIPKIAAGIGLVSVFAKILIENKAKDMYQRNISPSMKALKTAGEELRHSDRQKQMHTIA